MQTPLDFWRGCQPLGSRSMTIPTPAHYVSVVSPEWTVPYTATVGDSGLHYQAVHDDVDILNHHRITDIMCLIGIKQLYQMKELALPWHSVVCARRPAFRDWICHAQSACLCWPHAQGRRGLLSLND